MAIIRFGILISSDRAFRKERPDLTLPLLTNLIETQGWKVILTAILPDELALLSTTLQEWAESNQVDVILTSGGTGFSPRDVIPEATKQVVERNAPGISEAMRYESLKITPHAMLSRGVAGICRKTLIINLPGSPQGATENFLFISKVLSHAVDLIRDDPQSENGHKLTNSNSA